MELNSELASQEIIPVAPFPDMIWIPGGNFLMGSNNHYPEEAPAHTVSVNGFWMDRHSVTNSQFAKFVEATGYITFCEKDVDQKLYPNAEPEMLKAASVVFVSPSKPVDTATSHLGFRCVVRGE